MPSGTEIPWWEATAARFSYRNGAPFPKPPVSVTSVDLFPCLQSKLKNERGDPNLLVFPYLSSLSFFSNLKKMEERIFCI